MKAVGRSEGWKVEGTVAAVAKGKDKTENHEGHEGTRRKGRNNIGDAEYVSGSNCKACPGTYRSTDWPLLHRSGQLALLEIEFGSGREDDFAHLGSDNCAERWIVADGQIAPSGRKPFGG